MIIYRLLGGRTTGPAGCTRSPGPSSLGEGRGQPDLAVVKGKLVNLEARHHRGVAWAALGRDIDDIER